MHVLQYALTMLLAGLGTSSLSLLGWVLWPTRARAGRDVLESTPGRCLVVGLLHVLAVLILLAIGQRRGGGAGLVAAVLFAWILWKLLAALPGALAWLGEGVGALADRQLDTARATVTGALVLAGTALIPWLGWAVALGALAAVCGSGCLSRKG